MVRVLPAFVALAVVLGGCARNAIHTAVLNALPCPEDLSVVDSEEQENGSTVWEGRGCGRRVSFTCSHPPMSRSFICVQDGPAQPSP
jgi:hypothetical protein